MKSILGILILFFCFSLNVMSQQHTTIHTIEEVQVTPESSKKLLSNSEIPGISFIVSSNLKENAIYIKTNYPNEYKVRLIDYYARTRKVYKNNVADIVIDVAEFEKSIFIMNISDSSNNKLLASQVINLKRRHL